jgi:hypothetical protein
LKSHCCLPVRRAWLQSCRGERPVLQWAQYYSWADIAQTMFSLICGLAGPPAPPPSSTIAGAKRASPCKPDHDRSCPSTLRRPNLGSASANWKNCSRTTGCCTHNGRRLFLREHVDPGMACAAWPDTSRLQFQRTFAFGGSLRGEHVQRFASKQRSPSGRARRQIRLVVPQ